MEMESNQPQILGESLPVPCVQDLAKENLTSVPGRYVRPNQDHPTILDTTSFHQVPVIDLQKLLVGAGGDDHVGDSEPEKFHLACKDWGVFQVINHGVSSDLVEKVKKEVEKFFKLPTEERKRWWQKPGEIEGFGQILVVSEEQKLDWADKFFLMTLPRHHRKPHLFPKLPESLRDALEAYSTEMRLLTLKLLDKVAEALKIKGEELIKLFEEGSQGMRMNHYPPCPEPEMVTGFNTHTDPVGITILLQINEVEGLQIKKDGKWIPVNPLPDAFTVNIGDILEIVTNGNYKSVEHRAMVNAEKERLSLATVYSPKMDGDLGPASSLVTSSTPALFRTIGAADYIKGFLARKLRGKPYMDVMRI